MRFRRIQHRRDRTGIVKFGKSWHKIVVASQGRHDLCKSAQIVPVGALGRSQEYHQVNGLEIEGGVVDAFWCHADAYHDFRESRKAHVRDSYAVSYACAHGPLALMYGMLEGCGIRNECTARHDTDQLIERLTLRDPALDDGDEGRVYLKSEYAHGVGILGVGLELKPGEVFTHAAKGFIKAMLLDGQ